MRGEKREGSNGAGTHQENRSPQTATEVKYILRLCVIRATQLGATLKISNNISVFPSAEIQKSEMSMLSLETIVKDALLDIQDHQRFSKVHGIKTKKGRYPLCLRDIFLPTLLSSRTRTFRLSKSPKLMRRWKAMRSLVFCCIARLLRNTS